MSVFAISYCIDSKGLYRGCEDSILTSSVNDAFDLVDQLSENDTLYIDLLETKDALNINGSKNGIFIEVNTVKDGVFSKEMSQEETKNFLENVTVDFDKLDEMGFES